MSLGTFLAAGKSCIGMKDSLSPYRMRPQNLLPKFVSEKNPFAHLADATAPPASTAVSPVSAPVPAAAPKLVTRSLFDPPPANPPVRELSAMKPVAIPAPGQSEGSRNPVGVDNIPSARLPRVARGSQPWAGGHNPVGIEEPCKIQPCAATAIAHSTSQPGLQQVKTADRSVGQPGLPANPANQTTDIPTNLAMTKQGDKSGFNLFRRDRPDARPALKPAAISAWLRKLNPLGFLSRQVSRVNRARPRDGHPPVQTELSLERVKVMRNDLLDADLEIKPAPPAPARSSAMTPTAALPRPDRLHAAEPTAWGRLTARFFNAETPKNHQQDHAQCQISTTTR
jgi:hypothetical protein